MRMPRVLHRRFSVFLLCSGVVLYVIASALLTLTVHDQEERVVNEGNRQPLSIEHENEPPPQRVQNSSGNSASSENLSANLKKESVVGSESNEKPSFQPMSEQIMGGDNLPEGCPSKKIFPKKRPMPVKGDDRPTACVPHKASKESCKYAAEHFKFKRHLLDCHDKVSMRFCKFNHLYEPECVFPKFCSTIEIGGINGKTGDYINFASYKNSNLNPRKMHQIFKDVANSAFKFVFISCKRHNASLHSQQLMPVMLPPHILPSLRTQPPPAININIVLLDSLSRPHFYRSLPLLVEEFNRINRDRNSQGEVLDFISFQSIHGHSAENAYALFTGKTLPNNLTEKQKQRSYVGTDSLYGRLKQVGYTTMYQDDLCWRAGWGMRMELGYPKTWEKMRERIKKAQIDDTGLTFASCRLLRSLGLKHPFTRVKGDQICLNGDFQHNYILDHALNWHKHSQRPSISYTAINVAHDSVGIRTQTLNHGLIKHVRKTLSIGNTITILLADHGNTYTSFVIEMLEGRFEMYHPSLFMIIPDPVASLLGEDTMNNLRANQRRLFTMIDLNAGLRAIADFTASRKMPEKRGIFGLIPPERTCNDLPLKLPNLCVCEGWDNVARNDSKQISVLEFAVGVLNNKIESQRHTEVDTTSEAQEARVIGRRCHHLVPLYFENVRERNWGESMVTSMDFIVSAGKAANHKLDVFHIEVKSNLLSSALESYAELLSFDRLSPYEPYRKCADSGVDAQLCVCSHGHRETAKNGVNYVVPKSVKVVTNYMPKLRGLPSRRILYNRKREKCIYLVARNYHEYSDKGVIMKDRIPSAVLEAMNICANQSFEIKVKMKPYLMKVSSKKIISAVLHSDTLTFICALVTRERSWNSNYKFEYSVTQL